MKIAWRPRALLMLMGSVATFPLSADAQVAVPQMGGPTAFGPAPVEKLPLVMIPARGEVIKTYRIAMLASGPSSDIDGLPNRLAAMGLHEGVNVVYLRSVVQLSSNEHDPAVPLAEAVKQIAAWHPDVILQMDSDAGIALKANAQTAALPVVGFAPYALSLGLAKSYRQPGMNFTGFAVPPYRSLHYLRLFKAVIPDFKRLGYLYDPADVSVREELDNLKSMALLSGVNIGLYAAHSSVDFNTLMQQMNADGMQAISIAPSQWLNAQGTLLGKLAQKHHLPAVGALSMTRNGGLATVDSNASWDAIMPKLFKVLSGTNPGELAIERSFAPVITLNLKASKQLGLRIPENLIDDADVLIE